MMRHRFSLSWKAKTILIRKGFRIEERSSFSFITECTLLLAITLKNSFYFKYKKKNFNEKKKIFDLILGFRHFFHSEKLLSFFMTNFPDFPEASFPYYVMKLEISFRNCSYSKIISKL